MMSILAMARHPANRATPVKRHSSGVAAPAVFPFYPQILLITFKNRDLLRRMPRIGRPPGKPGLARLLWRIARSTASNRSDQLAAVDRDDGTGDIAAGRRHQQQQSTVEVGRHTGAAQRDARGNRAAGVATQETAV